MQAKLGAGFLLPVLYGAGDFDQFRRLAGGPLEGPFADQIDMADNVIILADRHFAQNHGPFGMLLKGFEDILHA